MKMMNIRHGFASCLLMPLAAMSLAGSVQAATDKPGAEPGEWSVGLGIGGGWSPEILTGCVCAVTCAIGAK